MTTEEGQGLRLGPTCRGGEKWLLPSKDPRCGSESWEIEELRETPDETQ